MRTAHHDPQIEPKDPVHRDHRHAHVLALGFGHSLGSAQTGFAATAALADFADFGQNLDRSLGQKTGLDQKIGLGQNLGTVLHYGVVAADLGQSDIIVRKEP